MEAQSATPSAEIRKLQDRYTDGYRVARTIVGLGRLVKLLGKILAVLFPVVGIAVSLQTRIYGFGPAILGVLFGGVSWLGFFVLGVLISSQGQILKALLDAAVNTSTFLTNEHRARIMSLV